MVVKLMFVPPGGGECDHSLTVDLPAIPQEGDAIRIKRGAEIGTEDFIVRKTSWHMKVLDASHATAIGNGADGELVEALVECEFAQSAFSSDSHRANCERLGIKASVREMRPSMY